MGCTKRAKWKQQQQWGVILQVTQANQLGDFGKLQRCLQSAKSNSFGKQSTSIGWGPIVISWDINHEIISMKTIVR